MLTRSNTEKKWNMEGFDSHKTEKNLASKLRFKIMPTEMTGIAIK